jgi:hypothetical protein
MLKEKVFEVCPVNFWQIAYKLTQRNIVIEGLLKWYEQVHTEYRAFGDALNEGDINSLSSESNSDF